MTNRQRPHRPELVGTPRDQKSAGFTLVELLVVIGIIAILVGILLPSLSRARKSAQTVQCASNLRQLYSLTHIYTNTFNGYTMPARVWNGSGQSNYWCGVDVLGPLMGVKRLNTTGSQLNALERIAKMLDCPSNDRGTPLITTVFNVDYTYNGHLGDDRSIRLNGDGTPRPGTDYNPNYYPWGLFKKRTTVPGNVIVALDVANMQADQDERFGSLNDLTTANAGRPVPKAGRPHQQNKANVLFHDGSVYLAWAFNPDRADPPNKGNFAPTTLDPKTTQLADWMIKAPGNLNHATSPFKTTKPEEVWSKGRPLPNF